MINLSGIIMLLTTRSPSPAKFFISAAFWMSVGTHFVSAVVFGANSFGVFEFAVTSVLAVSSVEIFTLNISCQVSHFPDIIFI